MLSILSNLFSKIFSWSHVQALKRHKVIWIVLFFSMGIKGMVNQIEQPFARSLVSCDVPVDPDVYTGSLWCGDRYRVIEEGMYISGMGQGQEHMAMLCSLTFVIIITGIWGPRISLLLGLIGVTASVGLFTIASSSPALGRSLFAMGQGLQGLYPIEYLGGVLMLHIGLHAGEDGEAVWVINMYIAMASGIIWNMILGNFVQLLELTNYRPIWTGVLILDTLIVLLVLFAFPPMKPLDAEKYKDVGPFTKVFREIWSYSSLIFDWRARRYLIHKIFENLVYPWEGVMIGGIYMAWHGWSQALTSTVFFWPQIIGLFTMPIWPMVERRFGNYNSFMYFAGSTFCCRAITGFILIWTPVPQLVFSYVAALFQGFSAKRGYVDNRFVEPEMMQRFQSAQWVIGYFMGMWVSPFYGAQFDAYASTMTQRMYPIALYLAALLGNFIALFYGIWDIDGVEGCGVSLKVLDMGGLKALTLWGLTANASPPEGAMTTEKWHHYDLQHILCPWEYTGAQHTGFMHFEHFTGVLMGMNTSPKAGQEVLQKLDAAIARAHQVHAEYHAMQAELTKHAVESSLDQMNTLGVGGEANNAEKTDQAMAPEETAADGAATEPAPEGKKDA